MIDSFEKTFFHWKKQKQKQPTNQLFFFSLVPADSVIVNTFLLQVTQVYTQVNHPFTLEII